MDKLQIALREDESRDEESRVISQFNDGTKFSWSTRIKGFLLCFVIGILLSLLGSFALFFHGGLTVFAVFYTIGTGISMLSTFWLMGPFNQIKKIVTASRIIATIVVVASFISTVVAAICLKNVGLAVLFVVIQCLAMAWYTISYIPNLRLDTKNTVGT